MGKLYRALAMLGVCLASQLTLAENDFYQTDNLQEVTTQGNETGFLLSPDPFANDTSEAGNGGDIDYSSSADSISLVSGAGEILVDLERSGPAEFVYVPPQGFTGTAIFSYTAYYPSSESSQGPYQITIDVLDPQANVVIAEDDHYQAENLTTFTNSNERLSYILDPDPLENDQVVNPQLENLSSSIQLVSGEGELVLELGELNSFYYTPPVGFSGTAVFSYILENEKQVQDTAQISISISQPSGDIVDDSYRTEDLQTVTSSAGILGYVLNPDPLSNDSIPNVDTNRLTNPASFERTRGEGEIIVSMEKGDPKFTFYPPAGFSGVSSFKYTIWDTNELSYSGQITLNVASEIAGVEVNLRELATVTALAKSMLTMQSDQIRNVRNRLSEVRTGANKLSIAGLNASIYGQNLDLGALSQSYLDSWTGAGAGDSIADFGRLGFFIKGNFGVGERNSDVYNAGYKNDSYSLTAGVDYRQSDKFIWGGALGLGQDRTRFAQGLGDQESDLASLSLYANYYPQENIYADGLITASRGAIEIDRNVMAQGFMPAQSAAGNTHGDAWSIASSVGYEASTGAWQYDVYGRAEYTNVEIDGYRESGSTLDLTVQSHSARSNALAFGGKVARVFSWSRGVLIPSLDAEWVHEFEDDARAINLNMEQVDAMFTIYDVGADREFASLSFAMSAMFANGLSAYFRAETRLLDQYFDRTVYSGGMRWEF